MSSRLRAIPKGEVKSPRILESYAKYFGDRDPVASPGTHTGTRGDWWTVLAGDPNSYHLMLDRQAWQASEERELPPLLKELALTRTGWVAESKFVFSQHCKLLRKAGGTEQQIAAIPYWSTADCFTDQQRVILGYTDDLVLGRGRVAEQRFQQLRGVLSEVAIRELTFMVGTYNFSAMTCRAYRLEYDDIDERIVEVPAPKAPSA